MGKTLPKCNDNYDKVEDKGKLWFDSGAEQWVDKYISTLDDHTEWAKDLLYLLFKDVKGKSIDKSEFSCDAPGAACNYQRTCGMCLPSFQSCYRFNANSNLLYRGL